MGLSQINYVTFKICDLKSVCNLFPAGSLVCSVSLWAWFSLLYSFCSWKKNFAEVFWGLRLMGLLQTIVSTWSSFSNSDHIYKHLGYKFVPGLVCGHNFPPFSFSSILLTFAFYYYVPSVLHVIGLHLLVCVLPRASLLLVPPFRVCPGIPLYLCCCSIRYTSLFRLFSVVGFGPCAVCTLPLTLYRR